MRTAGGHGVVQARHLCLPGPKVLSVCGCGAQARSGIRGMLAQFPCIRQVRIFSRSTGPIEAVREELKDRVEVIPVSYTHLDVYKRQALDWEDCSWTGHPAAGVIPCAWLAAEEKHKSGKELITAIVAGYEVYQRIAMAVQPSDERWKTKGWGLTSWQIFACILPRCV